MLTPLDIELEKINEKKQLLQSWWEAQAIALSCKAEFPEIISDISVAWEYGYINGVLLHTFWGMKDLKELNPVFRFLGKCGLVHNGNPQISEAIKRIVWNFGIIKLIVILDDNEGSSCKFIEIGTETVKKYKLVCPDMEFNNSNKEIKNE